MSDVIYYLQAGTGGPVRVDTCEAGRLRMRIGQLQAGNHEPLLLRALYQGGEAELAALRRANTEQLIHEHWYAREALDTPPALPAIEFDRDAEQRKVALRRMHARAQGSGR